MDGTESQIEHPKPEAGDAIYYTDGFILNPRLLSTLVVLFDRVHTFHLYSNYSNLYEQGRKLLLKFGINPLTQEKVDDEFFQHVRPTTAFRDMQRSMLEYYVRQKPLFHEKVLGLQSMKLPDRSPEEYLSFLMSPIGETLSLARDWAQRVRIIPPGKPYADEQFFLIHRISGTDHPVS